jgi:Protein of unknown function (DUF732)
VPTGEGIATNEILTPASVARYGLAMTRRQSVVVAVVAACAFGAFAQVLAPPAFAVPGPEVEYVYDVSVRRHYEFPNNDAIGYGFGICDKVTRGEPYAAVMGDVKNETLPNDEFAANYLVSNAVGILCPGQVWALRNSAAGYVPPPA